MKFDKNKILTCVTADQAKVGMRGWFASNVETLSCLVLEEQPKELLGFDSNNAVHAFKTAFQNHALFYPAPEPSYRPYNNNELNDLVGKVVTNKCTGNNKLVTERTGPSAIRVGNTGCSAKDLLLCFVLDGKPCGVKEEA